MASVCPNDARLTVGSNCRPLDFTLKFEEVILSILPDVVFLLLAPLRVHQLRLEAVKVKRPPDVTFIIKSLLSIFILGTSLAALIVSSQANTARITNTTTPSLVITIVASVLFQPLAFFEYSRTVSPSSLILFYCLIKGLFSATRLRTYNSTGIYVTSPSVLVSFSLGTASWFLFLLIELYEKDRVLLPVYKTLPKESKGSFVSRSMYLWLLPTLWKGRKSRFTLESLDEIPNHLKAEPARTPLIKALQAVDHNSSTYLLRATIRSFGAPFFLPVIPRIVLVLGTFAQPLLIRDILDFMSSPEEPSSKGWAIFGGFICIYSIITLAIALYREKLYAITVRYRAALVGAIYLKTLRLASHASRPLGTGVGSNYMSVDVERVGLGIENFHEIVAACVALPVAFALLYSEANWAAFLPIGVMIIALGITSYFARQAGKKQTQWSQRTDKRIKLMGSVIGQLIPMKLFAYEPYISNKVDALRREEILYMKKYYWVLMKASSISNTLMYFVLFTVIGVYVAIWGHSGPQNIVNVSKIFTIYATIQLLSEPFNVLGQFLPGLLAAYASLKRIQEFLTLDEKDRAGNQISKSTPIHTAVTSISLRGNFSWDKNSSTVLKDIDLDLPSNKLTLCVGPVASGKTSLIVSLLGELQMTSPPTNSNVPSLERIGYSAQDAFILPGTLRENILFGREYEEKFYQQTIKACALEVDFSNMQSGDRTRVTDARTLSGGQKQRICLARAVYSRAPLTLLDDPFSALDGETASHVFDALFGPLGILKGRTVLLVTHYVHHLPSADYVIVLEQGFIKHRGTWPEVLTSGYQLSELSKSRSDGQKDKDSERFGGDQLDQKPGAIRPADEPNTMEDVDDEYRNTYGRGLKPYLFWLRNAGIFHISVALVVFVTFPAIRLANQGYLKEWSESNGSNYPRWISGLAAFAVGALAVLLMGLYYHACILVVQIGLSIHSSEVKGLLGASTGWIQKTPAGKIINRFSQDIFELDFTFPFGVLNAATAVWGLTGSLIIIYISSPWLALSAPPMLLAYWLLLKFYLSSSKQLQQLEVASKSPLYTVFGTTLSGLEIIRAYRADGFFLSQNDKHLNASQGPFHYRFAGIRFLRTSLSFMTFIIAVGLAGTVIGLRKSTSISLLGMALSNLTGVTNLLSQLLTNWAIVENGTVSISRIQEIAELPGENQGGSLPISKMSKGWPAHGSIVFDNIKMRYAEDSPLILKGISFTVKPGMKVGICGRTGSGKSSTVQGLFRTVDKSLISGRILVDGVDITEIPLSGLRGSMSIVVQEPFLWHDTVRNNIDLENTKSDDQIWGVLEKVGLKTTFSNAPRKLETMVEDSTSLSRGERQLLCLARALLRSRRIVVLDEATSSMDLETDELVRSVIKREMKDYTVLTVAHRIATIIDFDLILVLEDGLIVETGSSTALLAKNGRFAQLAASQGISRESRFSLTEIE